MITLQTETTRKPKQRKLTPTERVLTEMLQENTGRAMCDSGDYYGRHWQQNQGKSFLDQPTAQFNVEPYVCGQYGDKNRGADISVTINLFPWLRERVDYDAKLTRAFNRWADKPENKDSPWLPLMETWATEVRHGKGLYGDGAPFTTNTYNGEDLLSQTIQYTYWTEDDGNRAYILLQIHGGCDVRGGYTAPRVFELNDDTAIFDNARATIAECVPEDIRNQPSLPGMEQPRYNAYWDTDSGYHWYAEGTCGLGAGKQLEEYEVSTDPADKGNGKIYVDPDGNAYGPIWGGRLEVSA